MEESMLAAFSGTWWCVCPSLRLHLCQWCQRHCLNWWDHESWKVHTDINYISSSCLFLLESTWSGLLVFFITWMTLTTLLMQSNLLIQHRQPWIGLPRVQTYIETDKEKLWEVLKEACYDIREDYLKKTKKTQGHSLQKHSRCASCQGRSHCKY